MKQYPHLYIDGRWVEPIEPARGRSSSTPPARRPSPGSRWAALRMPTAPSLRPERAFESFSTTSVDERIALIDRIIDVYESYIDEFSELIAREVGIPGQQPRPGHRPGRPHEGRPRDSARVPLRVAHRQRHRPSRADRRLRADLTVELADPDRRHQDHLRSGRRLHRSSPSPASTPPPAAPSWPRCCTRPTCRRACSTW